MRYAAVLGTTALVELMAHFLSLGWGIMTLLAAFAWVALTGASTAAKARSTEDRLTALVPVVGTAYTTAATANATANTAHTTATAAQSAASTAQSTANSASSTASSALSTANGCLPLSGGTISGALTVNGDVKSHSNLLADGTLYVNSSGHQLNIPVTRPYGLTGCPNPPTKAWGDTVVNAILGSIGANKSAGVWVD
jgi:hypothetical protein